MVQSPGEQKNETKDIQKDKMKDIEKEKTIISKSAKKGWVDMKGK
jgi:hypothetical protein